MKYFQESYEKCRDRFSSLSKDLQKKFNNVEEIVIPVPSRVGDDLTINCCYIPAQNNTEKLLIMSSGVHGVEGFAGSAVQQMFMNEIISSMELTNIGVFLIHAMNPYGFKVVRRVTENNIDLNRNADIDKELFKTKNEGYSELNALLNPEKKVDISSFENRFFLIKAVIMIVKHSLSSLRQAIMQGQYDFEKGLY
ncbi:MAG: M14 family metallopeptidase, partial [Desulfobacterales bacterium]